ncbi:hypothetical protein [Amycolatopsis antarctica]|uniref:hypothetical protein n=1 Tax=Amycolatopsis antarctica TaxID=1854586 RepID=UPI0010551028|nr:hypothetical protein [Amycolatopsis antarctica]
MATIVALTARVLDYQAVIVVGVLAAGASVAAIAVGVRRSVPWATVCGVLCLLIAIGVVIIGIAAMIEYQSAYEQLTDSVNRLRSFRP